MASIPDGLVEEAERAVSALQRLSCAPWAAWLLKDDAELPPDYGLAAWVTGGAMLLGQQQRKLLADLLAALSHGMAELGKLRLQPSNLHQHNEQLALLRRLWDGLVDGWGGCCAAEFGLSEAQQEHVLKQLCALATKAGLFTTTSSGCSTLAAAINAHAAANEAQQQQPDQQQQQTPDELEGSGVPTLAATLLLAACRLGNGWPGGGILSSPIASAVPALVQLAVAVIRSPAAACRYKPSEGYIWDVEASNPLQAAVVFTWGFANEAFRACQEQQQLEGCAAVGELLLLVLGLTAQLQHEQQQGLSPAPAAQQTQQEAQARAQQQQRQQLVVPPYHQQLLKVLGLPGRVSGVAQAAWAQCPPNTVDDVLFGVLSATLLRPDLALLPIRRDTSSTSSTSSSSQQAQQPGQQAATGTGVPAFVPVLLVLVEILALQPDARRWFAALDRLAEMLQPALDRRLELQLAKHLLPAVLRQLLPAAKHAAAQRSQPGAAAAAAASEQEKLQLLEVHLPVVVERLMFHAVKTPKGTAAAAAAFAQHTEEYSALLQAALRHSMQHSNYQAIWQQVASISRLLCSAADSTLLEAVSAGRQLPLLLASLLKGFVSLHQGAGGAASIELNSNTARAIQQGALLSCAQALMLKLPACLGIARQAASTDASSTSTSSNHSQRQLLAVLLARGLVVVGRLLQAHIEQNTALLAAPLQEQCDAVVCRQKALEAGDAIVDVLVEELQSLAAARPAQLPGTALQQLADEHVQPFKAALQGPLPADSLATAVSSLALGAELTREFMRISMQSPAVASTAQQLEACGAAMAGLLPLPDYCNYHACSSASWVSEGELVSGNNCVCGGCGVARYCSRECQVAHYKGWHKAVCKRLQQQQQQE